MIAPHRSAVAVIGPGRVGTTLALALPAERYRVSAVAGRRPEPVAAFRSRVPSARGCAAEEAVAEADLVLLAVPDDALRGVVRALATANVIAPGSRWVHVSGASGLEVLGPLRLAGARVAACHPAQAFPDVETGLGHLSGTAWAVTAAAADMPWVEELIGALGGTPHRVPEQARVLYHGALTLGANGTAAVVALSRDLLLGAGVGDPEAFLAPLVGDAARDAAARGAAALTGPVRRGDAGTVAAHLAELDVALPEAVPAYRELSRLALRYARRAGLRDRSADEVGAVLDTPDGL